jgi:hypothetical protein
MFERHVGSRRPYPVHRYRARPAKSSRPNRATPWLGRETSRQANPVVTGSALQKRIELVAESVQHTPISRRWAEKRSRAIFAENLRPMNAPLLLRVCDISEA